MPTCCVPGCGLRTEKIKYKKLTKSGAKITLHRLPKETTLLKAFINVIKQKTGRHFQVSKTTKICSSHFKDEDFEEINKGFRRLKRNTLPTIFHCASTLETSTEEEIIVQAVVPEFDCSQEIVMEATTPYPNDDVTVEDYPACCSSDENSGTVETDPLSGAESVCCTHAECDAMKLSFENELAKEVEKNRRYEADVERLSQRLRNVHAELQLTKEKLTRSERDLAKFKNEVHTQQARLQQTHKTVHDVESKLAKLQMERLQIESDLREARKLIRELTPCRLSFDSIKDDPKLMKFYTGIETKEEFNALFDLLRAGENGENVVTWRGEAETKYSKPNSKRGKRRTLNGRDRLLVVFCRLRLNLYEQDLAHRFGVSQTTISRIISSWIQFMYARLAAIKIWPSRDYIDSTMPESFKEKYPSTRVIIDATELKCESPSSFMLKTGLYSFYKSTHTFKGLIGIAPNGFLTFVSALFSGSVSDREITVSSGFLTQEFTAGDSIMADKGFDIGKILPAGVSLNIPPFRVSDRQFSHEEIRKTEEIAALRIHVERRIARIKSFKILSEVVPMRLVPLINQIWTVCALLTNFQSPLTKEKKTDPIQNPISVEDESDTDAESEDTDTWEDDEE